MHWYFQSSPESCWQGQNIIRTMMEAKPSQTPNINLLYFSLFNAATCTKYLPCQIVHCNWKALTLLLLLLWILSYDAMGPNTNANTPDSTLMCFLLPTDMMTQRRAGLGFCERLVTRRDPPFSQCVSTRCVSPSYNWPMRLMMTMLSVLITYIGPEIALGTESWIWFQKMVKVLWKNQLFYLLFDSRGRQIHAKSEWV